MSSRVSERHPTVSKPSLVPDCLLDTKEKSKFDRAKRRSMAQMALEYASDDSLALKEMEKLTTTLTDEKSDDKESDEELPLGPDWDVPTDEEEKTQKQSSEDSDGERIRYRKGKQRSKRRLNSSTEEETSRMMNNDQSASVDSLSLLILSPSSCSS